MKTHNKKRFKRLLKDLGFMRQGIITEFNSVNTKRFSEERAKVIRKKVGKDKALIKHIDPLVKALHEMLGEESQKLEKVPKVTVRKLE